MAKIKVENLTTKQLDYAVAICEGGKDFTYDGISYYFTLDNALKVLSKGWAASMSHYPSTNWNQGGPIIEREGITIEGPAFNGDTWQAHLWTDQVVDFIVCEGATPLIAAMRCYVISKLGKTVEVPDAL